jgi:hypothetical protein
MTDNETRYAKDNPRTRAFLEDIEAACRKHGLSLSHEDGHGGFMIEQFDEKLLNWLNQAFDSTEVPQ